MHIGHDALKAGMICRTRVLELTLHQMKMSLLTIINLSDRPKFGSILAPLHLGFTFYGVTFSVIIWWDRHGVQTLPHVQSILRELFVIKLAFL